MSKYLIDREEELYRRLIELRDDADRKCDLHNLDEIEVKYWIGRYDVLDEMLNFIDDTEGTK